MSKPSDDVLDFINSLPDSKPGTPSKPGAGSGDDFLSFLDELSAHEKAAKPKPKFEPKKEAATPRSSLAATTPSPEKAISSDRPAIPEAPPLPPASGDSQAPATKTTDSAAHTEEEHVIDPIASISSWWLAEGSQKVSSLWGLLASNAHQIGEQTYQIASSTSQQLSHQRQKFIHETAKDETESLSHDPLSHLSDRLNSIFSSMSQQIKDGLASKEDELLNIMLVHDMDNVDFLARVCARKFDQVMGQVEGGIRVTVSNFNQKHHSDDDSGAASSRYCSLGLFNGKQLDGEKLCAANLDQSVKDYAKLDAAVEDADEADGSHAINRSNVFIAIQAISTAVAESVTAAEDDSAPLLVDGASPSSFSFTMILKDTTNDIVVISKSQPFPLQWARWIQGDKADIAKVFGDPEDEDAVDPSVWVNEWLQDGVALCLGVVAQAYVTKRMGL